MSQSEDDQVSQSEDDQDGVERNEAAFTRQVVARTGRALYRTGITVRDHLFEADEPVELGGADVGPTPFDFLCAALASCTTITLRMYADRKSWHLDEVRARVEHSRVKSGEGGPTVDRFLVWLTFEGNLDAAQRARLTEIAARCPVHRTLVGATLIQTKEEAS